MKKDELTNISFQIIGYAGEAFSKLNTVLEMAQHEYFDGIEELIKEADEQIHKAHQFQTSLIVDETRGDQNDFTILAVHAQDHLMNTVLLRTMFYKLSSYIKGGNHDVIPFSRRL